MTEEKLESDLNRRLLGDDDMVDALEAEQKRLLLEAENRRLRGDKIPLTVTLRKFIIPGAIAGVGLLSLLFLKGC